MKKLLLSALLITQCIYIHAQETQTATVTNTKPVAVQLNRSTEALGISTKTRDKVKAMVNPPVNIALFAVDKRKEDDKANSDVIMVISIDQQNGKIKMSSIMRDTYVNIDGHGMGKINAAYALGGPQLAIKTINQSFDLDIKDYINVDFYSAAKIVDALGGVNVNVKQPELSYLNNYLDELAIYEKIPAIHVNQAGLQKLSGRQAVAYTRIRGVGNGDYERTERQRSVLVALFSKMKSSGQEMFSAFASEVLPNLETSMANFTLMKFAGSVLNSENKIIDQARFPLDGESVGKRINNIWYLTTDLKTTTNSIHNFIYKKGKPGAK
ncbi:LCP family protein [Pedobacter nyackensis]|uniref:Transcriptional attenuator, LytR family n=1 Tax=Pedobacter nyackensis TaxID=475255 RepID=A0A1W2DC91_9SPHI|nr:LCP family protein [Pedobacter nyackensis]SMC94762.1 transcriptional attenuator, LytR family [Pedobacter nyackensis]